MFLKFMSSFYENINLFSQNIFGKINKNMKPSSCMKMGHVSFFKLFRSLIFIGEMSELSSSLSPLLNSCHSICEFEQIKGHHQCNAKHFYFFSPVFFYNLYPPQYICQESKLFSSCCLLSITCFKLVYIQAVWAEQHTWYISRTTDVQ